MKLPSSIKNIRHKISIKTKSNVKIIDVEKIMYCKADGNYCYIYLVDSPKPIHVAKKLKEIQIMLKSQTFFRANRSFLVNLSYIEEFDRSKQIVLTLINQEKIPISYRKAADFKQIMEGVF